MLKGFLSPFGIMIVRYTWCPQRTCSAKHATICNKSDILKIPEYKMNFLKKAQKTFFTHKLARNVNTNLYKY